MPINITSSNASNTIDRLTPQKAEQALEQLTAKFVKKDGTIRSGNLCLTKNGFELKTFVSRSDQETTAKHLGDLIYKSGISDDKKVAIAQDINDYLNSKSSGKIGSKSFVNMMQQLGLAGSVKINDGQSGRIKFEHTDAANQKEIEDRPKKQLADMEQQLASLEAKYKRADHYLKKNESTVASLDGGAKDLREHTLGLGGGLNRFNDKVITQKNRLNNPETRDGAINKLKDLRNELSTGWKDLGDAKKIRNQLGNEINKLIFDINALKEKINANGQ